MMSPLFKENYIESNILAGSWTALRLGSVSHPVMMLAATNAVVFCTGQQPGLCNITGYELDSHHQRGGGYQRAAVLHEL